MSRPVLSLVICTLDEASSIGAVLREARQALAGLSFEIVVVDDSDDEQTAAIVTAHAIADQRVRLIRRRGARGLATAAIAGWTAARGDILALMDGDGQHEVGLLPSMVATLADATIDMAVASRYAASGGFGPGALNRRRHAMSRAATLLAHLCLRVPVSDPMSGFFAFRRSWFDLARPRLSGVGFKILVDLMMSGGRVPAVVECRASLRSRIGGTSKLDTRVVIELAALLVEKRSVGLIPSRFTLFACVGLTGVVVNLLALGSLVRAGVSPFWLDQGLAIVVAMVWNFVLNNTLTFRERRLRGWAFAAGLAAFSASCVGGAVLNEAVATSVHQLGAGWGSASVTGTVSAAIWNYWSSTRGFWTSRPAPATPVGRRLVAWARRLGPEPRVGAS